jgi:hypothetical protein
MLADDAQAGVCKSPLVRPQRWTGTAPDMAYKTKYQFVPSFLHIRSRNYHLLVMAEAAALNGCKGFVGGSQCVLG